MTTTYNYFPVYKHIEGPCECEGDLFCYGDCGRPAPEGYDRFDQPTPDADKIRSSN